MKIWIKSIHLIVLFVLLQSCCFKVKEINKCKKKKKNWAVKYYKTFNFFTKHCRVDDIPAHLDFITTCVNDNKTKKKWRALILIKINIL